jgi:TPR repeat protein
MGLKWLHEDAAAGDPKAQSQVAFGYLLGYSPFPRNPAQALLWFEKAAKQGSAVAQFELGQLYGSREPGIGPNFRKSLAWYRRAAAQGLARAEVRLAGFYEAGKNGLPVDPAKAAAWYSKAARHGDLSAALTLVGMYERGAGIERDLKQAAIWRAQAAGLGHAGSALKVGKALASGRGPLARDDPQAYVLLALAALRYEQFGERSLESAAPARDRVAARLTQEQRDEAQGLIDLLKVRFGGDAEKWISTPKPANGEN